MRLLVQKYGGKSLATPRHIREAAGRIRDERAAGWNVVVVVSAMGRMTNHLIALANRTVKKVPQRELDMLLTTGERISMSLLAMALEEMGVAAISFTGSQCGIVTTDVHNEAKIVEIRGDRIREELKRGRVVIVAGFQGVSLRKEITTLGRGGSDTTAVALAAALGADECVILTDVDGLYSADPKLVPGSRLLGECSYQEALELASLGAKMHARSIELAKRYAVRVRIGASHRRDSAGTRLVPGVTKGESEMERTEIRGVAAKSGYLFLRVRASLSTLADRLRDVHVPLRFFSYCDGEVRFVAEADKAGRIRESLAGVGEVIEEVEGISLVSAVGEGLASCTDTLPRFLGALRRTGAPAYIVVTNTISIVAAVPTAQQAAVARELHAELIERSPQTGELSGGLKKEEPPREGALPVRGSA